VTLKLLSLRKAALLVGLAPLNLKTAAQNGDVPVVSINGRLRFELTALANWAFGTRASRPVAARDRARSGRAVPQQPRSTAA
jgi:hypothetical protein